MKSIAYGVPAMYELTMMTCDTEMILLNRVIMKHMLYTCTSQT